MKAKDNYRMVLGEAAEGIRLPKRAERRIVHTKPVKQTIAPLQVIRALKSYNGAKDIIKQFPDISKWQKWLPTATFSVCQKTGTAKYLDIWDADHFDGFTDIKRNLQECRIWFSADGFTTWDSPQTKTGRINCYFRAPRTGTYTCNVQLQSYGGPATVECLIDSFNFGPLTFNGTINWPHVCSPCSSGYHSFRIRQKSGSFFFISLSVWKV